jgi:hypothetical protein
MGRQTQLTVGQGETFALAITILDEASNPLDLTSVSFSGSIKESYSSVRPVAEFDFQIIPPAVSGSLNIFISSSVTQELTAQDYVYDVLKIEGSDRRRLLEGQFIVRPGVTLTG